MAHASHISSAAAHSGFSAKVNGFFSGLGAGLVAYMERRSRAAEIAALEAKSDAELAELGVKREQIPAYVFRDLFYV